MDIRYDYEPYVSLLIIDKSLSKEEFLRRAGASQGFAVEHFSNIYDSIFSESEDLVESYFRYYQCEYPSFTEFLRREFALPARIAVEFGKALDGNDGITVIRWPQLNYGDNGVADLIFSEEISDAFVKALCTRMTFSPKFSDDYEDQD